MTDSELNSFAVYGIVMAKLEKKSTKMTGVMHDINSDYFIWNF